ncbi:restriction endonuclease subunit S [Burkholderia pseudomallei]|uniref:restriction endonuclease subunit S n=1 Tax=Burkholderia pseudomallei TaxID=28450 RepID=UPI0018A6B6E5|nr:restriction endonuclease subunit S [Burkholderia pseudomallei]
MGVIPEDWDDKTLGEIGESLIGLTYDPSEVREFGILVLRSSNIQGDALAFDDNVYVDTDIPERIMVRHGDVLICVRNGSRDLIGKSAFLDARTAGMTFGAFMAVHRGPHGRLVSFLFQSDILKRQISEHLGATINQITNKSLNSFHVPFPRDDREQFAIASALSDVDALLSSLDALIAKKRDIKQAAMQQLLTGKTRLPGFAGEWTVKRLDQLANIRSGGTPSTTVSRFWDGGIPWCTPTDITRLGGGKYLLDTSRQITSEGLSNSSAELIPANSVVMTSRATIGECAINLKPVTTNQGFKNFVPFEDTDVNFLYYLLQTQKQGFIQLCAGSTFLEIGKTQLAAYKVHLPSTKAEQTAIAEVLSDMDAELAALEARRDKTRLLKQGMMQELLTGKTRLV